MSSSDNTSIVTIPSNLNEELTPHLKTTLYFTFAFVTAWGWDLVSYGMSHVMHGMNPLQDQFTFGDHPAPKHLVVLLLEYLLVCCGSAIVTDWLVSVAPVSSSCCVFF